MYKKLESANNYPNGEEHQIIWAIFFSDLFCRLRHPKMVVKSKGILRAKCPKH